MIGKSLATLVGRPLRYTRGRLVEAAVKRSLAKRLEAVDAANGEDWAQHAIAGALHFVDSCRINAGAGSEYRYSRKVKCSTLYASVYACMTLSLTGRLQTLSEETRSEWVRYFDSFQNPTDGLFRDPVVEHEALEDRDWWGERHLALHLISAYTALSAKPRFRFSFLDPFCDERYLAKWVSAQDWRRSFPDDNDIDNKIMNVGSLLQYQRDVWSDKRATHAVSTLKDLLRDRINPQTGMWGEWDMDDPRQLSRMVQFAYHIFPLYLYDGERVENAGKVVDLALRTQNDFGGFGVRPNSSACEDIDSIDLLCRFADAATSRAPEIREALLRARRWVLVNQVVDGGFVFRLGEPMQYGHPQMSSDVDCGAMFPTWFRLLSLAYIARFLGQSGFFINRAPGLEY